MFFKDIVVEGLDTLRHLDGPAVIVANHQDFSDAPVEASIVHWAKREPMRYVSKAANMNNRCTAFLLGHLGAVPVDRTKGRDENGDRKDNRWDKVVPNWAAYCLGKERKDFFFYPEGSRSDGLELGTFHLGALAAAQANKVPIVPIGHYGTEGVLRDTISRWQHPLRHRSQRPVVYATVGLPVFVDQHASLPEEAMYLRESVQQLVYRAHALSTQNM